MSGPPPPARAEAADAPSGARGPTRRDVLMAGVATVGICAVGVGTAEAATDRGEPWDDGTFWDDGTGWID